MMRKMRMTDIIKTSEYHPPTNPELEGAYATGFLDGVNDESKVNPYADREDDGIISLKFEAWEKGFDDGMTHTARPR